MSPVIVVGAGLGGLAAAICLAARGLEVQVIEAGSGPGGKAAEVVIDGVGFDTGPSVLTLPSVLRGVLAAADLELEEVVDLIRPDPAFRYLWPDGTQVDVMQELDATEASVRESLGADAAREFMAFMAYSKKIWDAAAPHFVLSRAPSVGRIAGLGFTAVSAVSRIDSMRSMHAAIRAQVRSPYLQDLFARFATYNGSDVRVAPATLNCIAHVEMGLGAFGVRGGIHRLPQALEGVARRLGVDFRYGTPVDQIEVARRRIVGVRLLGGERLSAERVVINADVAHLVQDLLPPSARTGLKTDTPRSTSGWTAVIRRGHRSLERGDRVGHTALFPANYAHEFRDMFDRGLPPDEPTVYICDQELAQERATWADAHPLFVMANAPAEPADRRSDPAIWEGLRGRVLARLRGAGLIHSDDEVVWERTPTGLGERFLGSRGSLYGAASNSMFSAFQRPPNRLRRPAGLYLASGSAHPGGGMPLCLQSGRLAAESLLDDVGVVR